MARDVKNIVEIVRFGAAVSAANDAAKVDGKYDINDIVHLLQVVPHVEPAIKDAEQALAEFEDMDDAELAQLLEELKKVSIIGDKVEILEGVRVHLIAAKANYQVFLFWKNRKASA